MNIFIRSKTGIIKHLPTKSTDGPFVFKRNNTEIIVNANGSLITARAQFEVSPGLHDSLVKGLARKDVDDQIINEYKEKSRILHRNTKTVVNLIKQELFLYELRYLSGNPDEWSVDGKDWSAIPWGDIHVTAWGHVVHELDKKWCHKLQVLLDGNELPLLATEHIHESIRTTGDNFKWLEATIAAELAIKEILIRLNPQLETIILELPSPPIHKLYKNVLKSVSGETSPFYKELQKGAEIRNKLIHSTKQPEIDGQEVLDYINNVVSAINHLLSLERKIRKSGTNK